MAAPAPIILNRPAADAAAGPAPRYTSALSAVTTLFFLWGFITCLNDILIPYLKAIFQLSYAQANLINLCFFGAYFLMSIPAGKLVARVGYKRGMLLGFVVAAVGAFSSAFQLLNNVNLMRVCAPEFYGRVLSVTMMSFGMSSIASFPDKSASSCLRVWPSERRLSRRVPLPPPTARDRASGA